jgi:hypothetical protein
MRSHIGDLWIEVRIILNESRVNRVSGYGPVAGYCEHGIEPSDLIKGDEFLLTLMRQSFHVAVISDLRE